MQLDLFLLGAALFAGFLTVLAPCVFTLLPVIIGGASSNSYKLKPVVISLSTIISIIIFTILVQAVALTLTIPDTVWQIISGEILVIFGIFTVFPGIWDWINIKLGLSRRSDEMLQKASSSKKGIYSDILIGAALGPVFTSCSPTYLLILTPIISQSFLLGLFYISMYGLGLLVPLIAIGYLGQNLVKRFAWASDPNGIFKKFIGFVFIGVGIAITFGWHKDFQDYLVETDLFSGLVQIELDLLRENGALDSQPMLFFEDGESEQAFLTRQNLQTNTAKTLIDLDLVLAGGPPKDGIPAINNPTFIEPEAASPNLTDESEGMLLNLNGEQRFYPYNILVFHEIVNDNYGETPVSVTFCPLCGSAITFNREIELPGIGERQVNFGVSGMLYESNLLMYDDATETLWSQIEGRAVVGDLIEQELEVIDTQQLTFKQAKELYPDLTVLSEQTGFDRDYSANPYPGYEEDPQLYFPVNFEGDNPNIFIKDIMYASVYNDVPVAFHLEDLKSAGSAEIEVDGEKVAASYQESGEVSLVVGEEELPGYFTMWFSWANHNLDEGVRDEGLEQGVFWNLD